MHYLSTKAMRVAFPHLIMVHIFPANDGPTVRTLLREHSSSLPHYRVFTHCAQYCTLLSHVLLFGILLQWFGFGSWLSCCKDIFTSVVDPGVSPGSRILFLSIPWSRIQGSKRHRIPGPDPQHWYLPWLIYTFFLIIYIGNRNLSLYIKIYSVSFSLFFIRGLRSQIYPLGWMP